MYSPWNDVKVKKNLFIWMCIIAIDEPEEVYNRLLETYENKEQFETEIKKYIQYKVTKGEMLQ